jgi:asparagine synthase (glutamine-hydrolysing)
MAGIAGWIAPARRSVDENLLGAMAAALAHRARPGATLHGVIDTNARRQLALCATLRDAACGIALVLDGGIVNAAELRTQLVKHGYPFAEGSAAEVLLRAYQHWDKQVVKYLRGAFAFAIWDGHRDRLLLARDRFGEKPLYLHEKDGALYFASEVKALLKAGIAASVDLSSLRDCLEHRYVPGPRTLFAGIRKLQPGSYGLWQHGKLHEARYWSVPDSGPSLKGRAHGHPLEGFLASLEEAVALQPAEGVLLSGGIDSAVLLALAAAHGAPPKTFSLGVQGERSGELAHAAQAAAHFGAKHHEIVVAPHELAAHLEYLVACRDAPLPRPSELALCRLATEAARHVTSVFTGDGCDEVLGGYRRYAAQVMCGAVDAFPARLLAPLVSAGRFDTAAAPLKLKRYGRELLSNAQAPAPRADAQKPPSRLRRALYLDQTTWLPDQLLERNDRAANAAALELRMPFLDHCLVEYVAALPDTERVRGLTTKRILREAARRLLPAPLAQRTKGGWRLDVAGWLREELRDYMLEHLRSRTSLTRQYYDAAVLDRLLDEHLKGKNNHETLLWTLLNLEIWQRTYRPG